MNCGDSLSSFDGTNLCPGSYFAFVRDSTGCGSYTPCISTELLSLNKGLLDEIKINIEQNHLQINQSYDILKIYSLSGQVVIESNTPEENISIQELAAGPYVVSILKDGEIHNEKIVKVNR